ncbi:MAG: C-type lectin domain-containing protein, partial [Pseudomonadota bacterium]
IPWPSTLASKDTLALWNTGEPNNSGDCGQLYTSGSTSGLWDDTNCADSKPVACYNGNNWVIGSTVNMGSNDVVGLGAAASACPAGYQFAAPETAADSDAIAALTNSAVWINLQDKEKENIWVINEGVTIDATPWATGQPDNSGDCVAATGNSGEWNDLVCTNSFQLACQNRQTKAWQLAAAAPFGELAEMQRLCAVLGKDYEFAAPETDAEVAALNSVRTPANDTVWVNANDQQFEGFWQINWGKENWASGHPVDPANNQCAQVRISDGKWISADCKSRARILCSDGNGWRLGDQNIHTYTNTALVACPRVNGLTNRWQLATPRSKGEVEFVSQYVQSQSGSDTAWLNGRYLKDVGY